MYTHKKNRYSSHNQIADMVQPGSTVLDVGCGQDILSKNLHQKQCHIVGIDNIDIDESVRLYMQSFIQWDLDKLAPLPIKEKFDFVIVGDVLEHLRFSREKLNDIRNCMHPESFLIASTGNIALWVYRLLLLLGRFDYTQRGILDKTHVHLYTVPNFIRFIESCDYEIVETRYTPIPFELVMDQQKGGGELSDAITNLYHVAVHLWPNLFAYQIIIRARLKD